MLYVKELTGFNQRIIPLEVGEAFEFRQSSSSTILSPLNLITRNPIMVEVRNLQFRKLQQAAHKFRRNLNWCFLWLILFLGNLEIYIGDLEKIASFDLRNGLQPSSKISKQFHIEARSHALYNWFAKPYGTSDFVISARFDITEKITASLKWLFLFSLLVKNKLALTSTFRMLCTPSGIRFLFDRREEAIALFSRGKFSPGEQR
jgi:hypothetical protein